MNFDTAKTWKYRILQLHEFEEEILHTKIYKEKTKWHDKKDSVQGILGRTTCSSIQFEIEVVSEKTKIKRIKVFLHGVVELTDSNSNGSFKVDGQIGRRVKEFDEVHQSDHHLMSRMSSSGH